MASKSISDKKGQIDGLCLGITTPAHVKGYIAPIIKYL